MAPKQPVAGPSRIKAASTQAPPPSVSVSAFSPSRTHFATAQPVLGSADKLIVWDIIADRLLSEWEVEGASKATTVSWASWSTNGSRKKRRRRSGAGQGQDGDEDVILITTDKGALIVYSPRRGEVLRRLDVGNICAACSDDTRTVLVSNKDVLVLSHDLASVQKTFPLPSSTSSPTAIALLPTSTGDRIHLLVASASVIQLHLNPGNGRTEYTSPPLPVTTSSVTALYTLPTTSQGTSFLAISQDDRTVSQYTFSSPTTPAKLSYRYASPTLSPAHSISLSPSLISVLHHSGEVSLFPLPTELDLARPKSDSKPSSLKLVEGKEDKQSRLTGAAFAPEDDESSGSIFCGKMVGGGRVKWVRATYEQPEGGVKSSIVVKTDGQDLVNSAAAQNAIPIQRYAPPPATTDVPQEDEGESAAQLPTDVDMADMSLGERLLALPNGDNAVVAQPSKAGTAPLALNGTTNAASLTRLLVQALHTSDPALLTLCLSHRDPVLIRNTIRKMPAPMALPLLKACVERLGRGKNSSKRGGGRGGGQGEQQGRGTVEWVKGVLVERGAILMTMPSLPLHLATLSKLLESRMQLYQPLLSLSGRLDLALAQIAMRRLALEQQANSKAGDHGVKYVEGESDDESDDEVRVEVGEGEGEVEDIDMRVGEESDDEEDESDEEDDEDDESDDLLESGSEDGGLLDLDAEEGESGSESEEDDE